MIKVFPIGVHYKSVFQYIILLNTDMVIWLNYKNVHGPVYIPGNPQGANSPSFTEVRI